MPPTAANTADLRSLVQTDIRESQDLQTRIDQLRADIHAGNSTIENNVLGHLESQSKKMSKDLAHRIEEIEDVPEKSAGEREYLQALNARQVVWDRETMQISEIRDLMFEVRRERTGEVGRREEFLGPAETLPRHRKGHGYGEPDTVEKAELSAYAVDESLVEDATLSTSDRHPIGKAEPVSLEHAANVEDVNDTRREEVNGGEVDDKGGDPDDEAEPDNSSWPLCYRILDIDPSTEATAMDEACRKARSRLSPKHNPACQPNDADAPARWAAIMKASDTLRNPERKNFYDIHGRTPSGLEDFAIGRLSI